MDLAFADDKLVLLGACTAPHTDEGQFQVQL